MKKRSLMLMLAFLLVFASAIVPSKAVSAKSNKCWYGKYSELSPEAEKAIRFKKGDRVQLKGKFTFTASKYAGDAKEKKINKTFKLAKSCKFYINDTNAEKNPLKKVSKKEFKKNVYSDVSHAAFKVKKGKIVKAIVSLN